MRSLLIVDHTLKSYDGHSYNYDMALAKAASHVFDQVDVYGDKRFRPKSDLAVIPALTNHSERSFVVAKRWLTRLSELRGKEQESACYARENLGEPWLRPTFLSKAHRYLSALETLRAWKSLARSVRYSAVKALDIFIQQACMAELVATELLARQWKRGDKRLTIHLVVRHSPERTCSKFESKDYLQQRLQRLVALTNPKVYLYTDSQPLSRAFLQLVPDSSQFKILPVPVVVVPSSTRRTNGRVRLGFLGSPRMEKGFGLIPSVLDNLPPILAGRPIELAIQTLKNPGELDVRRISRWLQTLPPDPTRPPLVIWEGPVSSDTYYDWFCSTDILLGLYTSPKYIASTSGVFVEAIHCGVPTITFGGTWVSDQIERAATCGLRIGETIKTLQELPEKAEKILLELDRYRQDTLAYLDLWKEFHTPDRIVATLLNPGEETTFPQIAGLATRSLHV